MNKAQIGTQSFEDVEEYLRNLPKLSLENFNSKLSEKTIKKRILELVSLCYEFETEENGENQCYAGAYRSIGDLYRLYIGFRPAAKFEKFHEALDQLVIEGALATMICTEICRRVWWKGPYEEVEDYPVDEFGFKYGFNEEVSFGAIERKIKFIKV